MLAKPVDFTLASAHGGRWRESAVLPLAATLLMLLSLAGPPRAHSAEPYTEEELLERVQRLEWELRALRTELKSLSDSREPLDANSGAKQNVSSQLRFPDGSACGGPGVPLLAGENDHYRPDPSVRANVPVVLNVPTASSAGAEGEPDWFSSLPRLEDLAWRKGDFQIVPYGIGWLNVAYDTSRTATGPFTLFVFSEGMEGEPSFSVNARATRFGLDISGPTILDANSGGRIEFDFHGFAETENRTGVLLRHAYGEFKTEGWRLLGGQTWDVISPLFPNVLNYTVGWAAGNIGYRRAQVRVERYVEGHEGTRLTLQGSINRTIVIDFVGAPELEGEDSGWPTLMGRVAMTLPPCDGKTSPVELGISGHIGEEGADFLIAPIEDDRRFLSWSVNTDLRVPLTKRCGVQGEFFFGQVLGTFLGGINQGIDPVEREGIRSIGGWVELWYYITKQLHCHVGYGIDDPNDDDLSAERRTLNQFYFGNLMYDVTSQFRVGLEASWWETHYVGLSEGESLRLEGAMQYRF